MSEAEKALLALEAVAKIGRSAWEDLAERIANSELSDEIHEWLQLVVEGEI